MGQQISWYQLLRAESPPRLAVDSPVSPDLRWVTWHRNIVYNHVLIEGRMTGVSRLDRFLSIVLTLATVTVAAVVVESRLRSAPPSAPRTKVRVIEGWSSTAAKAQVWLSDSTRQVAVSIFTDFECPFCRMMDSVVAELEARHPEAISRSLIHFPLANHRFAMPAARAFECASEVGRGREMQSVLMNRQHGFGLQAWHVFAREAGVRDSVAFESCMANESPPARIAAGTSLAARLKLSGTPAVVINGRLYDPAYIPDVLEALEEAISAASRR